MLQKLIKIAKIENVKDFLSVGYIEEFKSMKRYQADLRFLYLELSSKLIEFESIEQYSKLRIKLVSEINFSFEIDEDDSFCTSRLGDIILVSTDFEDNKIEKIIFYGLEMSSEELICDAIELTIHCQKIFLDPSFLHGIGVGGNEQELFWKRNFENRILPLTGQFPDVTEIKI